jgi:Ca2+-transporting ATPase
METRRLVHIFGAFGLGVCGMAVALYGLLRGSWLDALLAGIALGMPMLPEEFPLILTVFTVMGAWRISRAHVLTRRAAAIETLGAATVLCTDKTGTLTENRMSIVAAAADGEILYLEPGRAASWPKKLRRLVNCGSLASVPDSFDPMDKAFQSLDKQLSPIEDKPARRAELVRSYGLRPDLLAVTQVWKLPGEDRLSVAAKGAPEAIARLCQFGPEALAVLPRVVARMAGNGMRVLAVAEARFIGQDLPNSPKGFGFAFLGLVGLADPLRRSVVPAVRECRSAGIRVVMITGDHPATALAIAHKAGLAGDRVVLTGADIEAMDEAELRRRMTSVSVFARIMPVQKLRIIRAFKANGDVVAMTGDGVNDAPSLKAADIGIAMGGRGTDVARETSALVLLDDDFGSIVETVRLGRRIYDNLRKAMGYILALHVPIAGLALLPLMIGLPLVLSPIHIAFLEMVIDPVCSVVFEAEQEERDVMRRPPRAAMSRLFSPGLVLWSLLQGALAFVTVASLYLLAFRLGISEGEVRAHTFVALVFANLGLVLVNRTFGSSLGEAVGRHNPTLWWVSAATAVLLGLVLVWEPARGLFRFDPLHADGFAVILLSTAGLVVVLELLKRIWHDRLTA